MASALPRLGFTSPLLRAARALRASDSIFELARFFAIEDSISMTPHDKRVGNTRVYHKRRDGTTPDWSNPIVYAKPDVAFRQIAKLRVHGLTLKPKRVGTMRVSVEEDGGKVIYDAVHRIRGTGERPNQGARSEIAIKEADRVQKPCRRGNGSYWQTQLSEVPVPLRGSAAGSSLYRVAGALALRGRRDKEEPGPTYLISSSCSGYGATSPGAIRAVEKLQKANPKADIRVVVLDNGQKGYVARASHLAKAKLPRTKV